MKRYAILGAVALLFGTFSWWAVQTVSFATHFDPNTNYDPTLGVGTPEDEVDDGTPD